MQRGPAAGFASLRRITSGGRLIPEIDGFRFLAILLVLNDHIYLQVAQARGVSWPALLMLPGSGTRGVFLFFALSGFILGLPFARDAFTGQEGSEPRRFNYRQYLMRRVTRLEPPYFLTLVLRFVLLLAVMNVGLTEALPHFLASAFYLHNLVFGTMSPVSPPTWSLEVEVQFYLLAPLLGQVFYMRSATVRRTLLASTMLGFAVAAHRYGAGNPRLGLSLVGNLQYFCAGLLLCDLHVTRAFRRVPGYAWDLVGLCTLVPLLWDSSALTLMMFPFGVVVFYFAGLQGHFVRRFFAATWVSIAGGMCYSVYLTHGTVLAVVASIFTRVRLASLPVVAQRLVVIGGSLTAVFLVGTVLFVLLERPCMDPQWPKKLRAAIGRGSWRGGHRTEIRR